MKKIIKNQDLSISIYLKGILMGICDLIPGISGGTIAFITGIYERLIRAIRNIGSKKFFEMKLFLLKFDFKNFLRLFQELDFLFLIILFAGIFTAILFGAKVISYLLENYYVYVLTFFIGLILASSKIIHQEIKIHSKINFLFAFIGFLFGVLLLFLIPKEVFNPSFLYVLISGFMAIFALFLPGISGSFILLILGVYKYIIDLVKEREFFGLIPFAIGAILGVFVISRLVLYLFKKDRCKTLYTLLGLVLGTLFIPLLDIVKNIEVFDFLLMLKLLFLFFGGFLIVYFLNRKFKI